MNDKLTTNNSPLTIKVVPALRFPEFSGEWSSLKLGTVAAFSKGKGISKSDIEENGGLECIRYGQLYTDYAETIKKIKSRTNIPAAALVLSEANDVIIPASGETQIDIATASCVLKSGIALGSDLNIIKTKHNGIFLSYYLNSKRKVDIARLSQGVSVIHLYAAQLKLLHLNLPVSTEQQKIASFLTSVDTKIEQLGKKKALLEKYKKGMMQKLFSQALRFKDELGNNKANGKGREGSLGCFPDWKKKTLGDVASFKKGKGIAKADIAENGRNKCIRYGELYTAYNEVIKTVFSRTNTEKNNMVLSEENDILMPTSDVTPNGLATASAVNEAGIILGGDILIIRTKKILNSYLCYFIASHKNLIKRLVSGVTVYHIYGSDMATLPLNIPSIKEQTKIANFFTTFDKKIDLITTELNQAKTFKKGLLQQMFV